MIYTANELIEEFYQENGFSSLSLEEVKLCCRAQFELINGEMQSGNLRDIRLKYFGKFVVYPGRVKHLNNLLEKQKEEGIISSNEYERLKMMYNGYNERHNLEKC